MSTYFSFLLTSVRYCDILALKVVRIKLNERLLTLRTVYLKLSQEEFGNKIGVTRAAVSRYENGDRKVSEPILLSICRTFHVNYYWLVNGDGDPFVDTPESVIDEIAEEYELDDIDRKMLEKYLSLSQEQRRVIKDYFRSVFT